MAGDSEDIVFGRDGGVATVTLNRPDVHNAFNSLMQRELHALWRALRRHDAFQHEIAARRAGCAPARLDHRRRARLADDGRRIDHVTRPQLIAAEHRCRVKSAGAVETKRLDRP